MGKNTSSVIVMVPITARDCEERALRDNMPALGYVAIFLRVSTVIMSLGGARSPRYHTRIWVYHTRIWVYHARIWVYHARTWVRGNLLDGWERYACHTRTASRCPAGMTLSLEEAAKRDRLYSSVSHRAEFEKTAIGGVLCGRNRSRPFV